MEWVERKEYKYYAPLEYLEPMRKYVHSFMNPDPFCADRPGNEYTVRSVYLDTPRYLFYFQKIDGQKVRKKLRVRTYNDPERDSVAFLEIKRRISGIVYKERAMVPLEEATRLMQGYLPHLIQSGRPIQIQAMQKFHYLIGKLNLEPKVVILYEREAFTHSDDPGLRITFDKNVRSILTSQLDTIGENRGSKVLKDGTYIVEVKFYGIMPLWIKMMVRDYRLRLQAISKYCNGLDAWFPSGQLVRGFA